ncbi:MAG: hypothetical protein PSV16_12775 [Flavobacterium sp.]|nr:hypothetical protein [Flavobacterium sp.]
MENNHILKSGTICGTLLCFVQRDIFNDIVRTIILAATGATVSFLLTLFYRWVWKKQISKNK